MDRKLVFQLLFCAGLALFWVLFLWNFWNRGPYALGLNAFIFLSLLFGLFIWALRKNGKYTSSDLAWIIPISLIIISFLLYDNPFLKMVSLLVLPAVFTLFYSQALRDNKRVSYWGYEFVMNVASRLFSVLGQISESAKTYLNFIIPADRTYKRIIVRVVAGIIILLVAALTVFVPLLSSADTVFSQKVQVITNWIQNIFSTPIAYKTIVFATLSVLLFSLLTALTKQFDYTEKGEDAKQIDSIIVGIVLGGILCIYMLFLWVQINRLWVGALPFDFKETEQLVKSGFWQLLALSIINILIYFFAYRKTIPTVQNILAAFTAASLLLLASAEHRMGLYVTYYGFSYEKFFASYTVIYCTILFLWLISQLFRGQKANIIKFVALLFLWMFALVSVFPVEQFIFRINMALYDLKDSRIILSEMKMLSPDVLTLVKKNQGKGFLEQDGHDWNNWITKQEKIVAEKTWYERNFMNIIH